MLFGPKLNTVFASRWKALTWAGLVLVTAYCTVPQAEQASEQIEAGKAAEQPPAHTNPWAIDSK